MNSSELVKRAIHFQNPDRIPIRHMLMDAALYEHGQKLPDLYKKVKGDFGDPAPVKIPKPAPKHISPDGNYRRIEKDCWGVEWEYIKFGIAGHPLSRPLDNIGNLKTYKPPEPPRSSGKAFADKKTVVKKNKETGYCLEGWINLFELMHAVRNFENVLMDVLDNTREINRLADMIVEYQEGMIQYFIALGVDGIMLADDWGSQNSLLIGRETWLEFFKPRYEKLIKPVKSAGIDVFFHSCGHILSLLDDLADLGVDVIWPQYASNDPELLAKKARERKMCVELHMDRQTLMTFGVPEEIDAAVKKARGIFGNNNGGLIYHAEIDNGFSFENIKALLNAFKKYS